MTAARAGTDLPDGEMEAHPLPNKRMSAATTAQALHARE